MLIGDLYTIYFQLKSSRELSIFSSILANKSSLNDLTEKFLEISVINKNFLQSCNHYNQNFYHFLLIFFSSLFSSQFPFLFSLFYSFPSPLFIFIFFPPLHNRQVFNRWFNWWWNKKVKFFSFIFSQ